MSMLTATLNTTKTAGHALVVGARQVVVDAHDVLSGLGFDVDTRDDPYAAMIELCRRPLVFRAVVLSLAGLYRDELTIIATIRRRFPHVAVYLADTYGRQAALAEAMRLGAEGLIDNAGLHSFADAPPAPPTPRPTQFRPVPEAPPRPAGEHRANEQHTGDTNGHSPASAANASKAQQSAPTDDPVLTADELRALLGE